MWQVSSKNGRDWVSYDGPGTLTASDSRLLGAASLPGPVEYPVMSGRTFTGPPELVVFLRAVMAVGDNNYRVSGRPPLLPAVPAPTWRPDPGLVF